MEKNSVERFKGDRYEGLNIAKDLKELLLSLNTENAGEKQGNIRKIEGIFNVITYKCVAALESKNILVLVDYHTVLSGVFASLSSFVNKDEYEQGEADEKLSFFLGRIFGSTEMINAAIKHNPQH